MYEVGIAHAVRLPEEVVIFRSDGGRLPFDVTTIRVNKYDPDNELSAAKQMIEKVIREAIDEVNLLSLNAVDRTANGLDYKFFNVLMNTSQNGYVLHSIIKTCEDTLVIPVTIAAIQKTLDQGLLVMDQSTISPGSIASDEPTEVTFRYHLTDFGQTVLREIRSRLTPLLRETPATGPMTTAPRHTKPPSTDPS